MGSTACIAPCECVMNQQSRPALYPSRCGAPRQSVQLASDWGIVRTGLGHSRCFAFIAAPTPTPRSSAALCGRSDFVGRRVPPLCSSVESRNHMMAIWSACSSVWWLHDIQIFV